MQFTSLLLFFFLLTCLIIFSFIFFFKTSFKPKEKENLTVYDIIIKNSDDFDYFDSLNYDKIKALNLAIGTCNPKYIPQIIKSESDVKLFNSSGYTKKWLNKSLKCHSLELLTTMKNNKFTFNRSAPHNIFNLFLEEPQKNTEDILIFLLREGMTDILSLKEKVSQNTILHYCALGNYINLLEFLLVSFENETIRIIDAKNSNSKTPLLLACRQNNTDIVKMLVQAKASLIHDEETGLSPFLYSIHHHSNDVAIYFIKNNIDSQNIKKAIIMSMKNNLLSVLDHLAFNHKNLFPSKEKIDRLFAKNKISETTRDRVLFLIE